MIHDTINRHVHSRLVAIESMKSIQVLPGWKKIEIIWLSVPKPFKTGIPVFYIVSPKYNVDVLKTE
jgi:hypothetical protein